MRYRFPFDVQGTGGTIFPKIQEVSYDCLFSIQDLERDGYFQPAHQYPAKPITPAGYPNRDADGIGRLGHGDVSLYD